MAEGVLGILWLVMAVRCLFGPAALTSGEAICAPPGLGGPRGGYLCHHLLVFLISFLALIILVGHRPSCGRFLPVASLYVTYRSHPGAQIIVAYLCCLVSIFLFFTLYFLFRFLRWESPSLCSPGWPATPDRPASAFPVLELPACTTVPSSSFPSPFHLHASQFGQHCC